MKLFDRDSWQEVLHSLGSNIGRSILTAFGVFWGILILVIMLAGVSGLKNSVSQEFAGFSPNSIYVWTQSTTMDYKGLPQGRWFSMTMDDYHAIKANISEAEVVAPRNEVGGWRGQSNVKRGNRSAAFGIIGDIPEVRDILPLEISEGRYLNKKDVNEKRKIAIIGTKVINDLYAPGEEVIGSHVMINGVYFTVVGTFETKKTGFEAEQDAQTIFVPLTSFQQAFNMGNWVGYFGMSPKEGIDATVLEEKVLALLKERHKVHPNDEFAFGVENNQEDFRLLESVFTAINIVGWFVGSLTLLAGIIGISNIMLVTVKERTKEIGVRRALGAPPSIIVFQIMSEATLLVALAGFLGILLGVWSVEYGAPMIEGDSFRDPEIELRTVMTAFGILLISGCLAGLIPALRALDIKPVEALRAE